jgi:NAD-dependent SIR2 family protein deacetylase
MAEIISEKLKSSNNLHRRLVQRLKRSELLANTFFITTNYDILCDNALLEVDDSVINYGFDFRNNWEGTLNYPDQRSSLLFKLHGSLNWLLCPTCNTVKQTPYVKSVYHLVSDPNQSYCNKCSSFYSPIIIPPTFYKDMSNVYLNMVWNKAELNLTYAAHLIFCGYSFPDADIHIKYLIKRIQKNRNKNNLKITVVNNHVGKSEEMKLEEKSRYTRFLGEQLNYTELSFEEFAANPGKILGEVKAKSSKSKKSIVY